MGEIEQVRGTNPLKLHSFATFLDRTIFAVLGSGSATIPAMHPHQNAL